MVQNSCKYCGNSFEQCECDPETKTFKFTDKSNKAIKDYFKSQIPLELQPYVDIAKKEYEERLGKVIDLKDPKLPQYQRSAVMSKALVLFLSNKK